MADPPLPPNSKLTDKLFWAPAWEDKKSGTPGSLLGHCPPTLILGEGGRREVHGRRGVPLFCPSTVSVHRFVYFASIFADIIIITTTSITIIVTIVIIIFFFITTTITTIIIITITIVIIIIVTTL